MKVIEVVVIFFWKIYQLVYFLDKIFQKFFFFFGNVKKFGDIYLSILNVWNVEFWL